MTIIILFTLQVYDMYELPNCTEFCPLFCVFSVWRGQPKCSCTIAYGSETCGTAHWNDKAIRHFHLRLVPSAAAEGDDYLFFPFQEMELQGSHAWDALIRIFQPTETWKKPLEWNLQLSSSALSFHKPQHYKLLFLTQAARTVQAPRGCHYFKRTNYWD